MMKNSVLLLVVVLSLFIAGSASAQWSPDSLQNLQICDLTGEQVLPKVSATSDGGCFISWFDSRSGQYCLYLQRLNAQGEFQFAADGLLISDKPQQSWLVDYDMAVDGNDNAVLVFSDVRHPGGDLDVSAYMIDSDGTFVWGDDGICLSDTTVPGFEPAPKVTVTPDGNSVFVWGKSDADFFLVFQKISPDGNKLWGEWGITKTSAATDLSSPDVVSSGADSVIVLWKSSTGTYPYQTTFLYTQKYDDTGTEMWSDTDVLIYNSGAVTAWNYPEIIPDGEGGAVYGWYDAPSSSVFNVWVQHMDSGGNMLFPMNGAQASTNSSDRLHMSPSVVCGEDQIFVFWTEENGNQNQYGLYGQSFSPTGNRLWTDNGLELIPLGGEQISFVRTLSQAGGIYIGYLIGSLDTAVRTIRTDYSGTVVWGPATLSAASFGGKDDLEICPGNAQSAYFAWNDNRNGSGIYAQNINIDGSLGPFLGTGDGDSRITSGSMEILPNPSTGPVSISFVTGESGITTLKLYDISGRLVKTLVSGDLNKGTHTVWWDKTTDSGKISSPGVYFARLSTGGTEASTRLILL